MKHNLVARLLVGSLLLVAAGIVVHAPLVIWLGTIWPEQATYFKAWKELVMGLALVLLIVEAARRHKVNELLGDRLMQLALVYAGLHFALLAVFQNGLGQAGAGLLIDLRFVLYFVLVYGTLQLHPRYRSLFLPVFAAGAVIVLGFALLQQFILPRDILTHIGYGKDTIAPYLLVDDNPEYVRINSTLRGPNPLGAYAVIVLGVLAAVAARTRLKRRDWWILGGAATAAGVALGASYSRSSLIAAGVTLLAVLIAVAARKLRRKIAWALVGIAVVGSVAGYALRETPFVANVILHNSPTTGAEVDSNADHLSSLVDGAARVARQPLGAGIGSTGSASLVSDKPLIIENQYLFVAHEAGWIGLALFVWLYVEILRRLWTARRGALALGVFASGLGLAVIGLFLPVWTDDTVSIVWWGLAAVAIGGRHARKSD